jgi:hypothetical protein
MNERRTASVGYGNDGQNDNPIVTCGNGGSDNKYLHNTYRNGTDYWNGQFGNDLSVTVSSFTNSTSEPIRYGFTLCSSTSGRKMYVYGDSLGNPITLQDTGRTTQLSGMPSNTNLILGSSTFSSGTAYYLGEMYEILIFNTSLQTTDIQTIYTSQSAYAPN